MNSASGQGGRSTRGVANKPAVEARRRRGWIGGALWRRARTAGEIFYGELDRDRTFSEASALTYKTLFSLLPIFVLTLLVLSAISAGGGENALDVTVKRVMFEQLSLDKLQLTDSEGHILLNSRGAPVTLAQVAERMIERAKKAVNAQATGVVAFGILIYGALSLMIVIEGAFNQIYGVTKARSWPRRIGLY